MSVPPQKRFTCNFCKSFKTNSEHHLSIHIKLQHPKHCNYCGKDFSTRKYLKKHIASVHEGNKVNCQECGKYFSSAQNLMRHKEVHEKAKYECNQCPNTYSLKRNLDSHVRQGTKWFLRRSLHQIL